MNRLVASVLIGTLALILSACNEPQYNRTAWGDWSKHDGTCNTREYLIRLEGTGVYTDKDCKAVNGRWYSTYDDTITLDPRTLDIDHVVPLHEAFDSGAQNWSRIQMNQFYNDLDNLMVVSARSNRSKGDKDPASWLPVRQEICDYLGKYTFVKSKYRLSYDERERGAILAQRCRGVRI